MKLNSSKHNHANRMQKKWSLVTTLSLAAASAITVNSLKIPTKPPSQDDPDLIQPSKIRLSHSGLYVNLPSLPLQPPQLDSSSSSLLSLYLDTTSYKSDSVKLEISSIHQRTWEDITYNCGEGGIENCRTSDLHEATTATFKNSSPCQPLQVSIPGRVDFHLQECLSGLDSFINTSSHEESSLTSTVLTVTVNPSTSNSEAETHSFWLAHLVNPDDDIRALWPLQGTAHRRPGMKDEEVNQEELELRNREAWLELGKEPNRIAGLMEDPYLPKAAIVKEDDPDKGVDMKAAFWRLGISIRAPLGHENSSHTTSSIRSVFQTLSEAEQESLKSAIRAEEEEEMRALANFNQRYKGRRGLEKRSQTVFETTSNPTSDYSSSSSHSYSSSDLSTLSSLTPEASNSTFGYSLILSPVGGQVVYLRSYEIPIVPISGAGKSLNNEKGLSLQIRDEFGFVYQIFGISPLKVGVKEGDLISRGQFLGGISKRPLSDTPLSRRKPADLPKNVRDSPSKAKYYPFRYRELRLNVARPSSEWKEWKEPYAKGWQYFNPLNFLSKGKFESRIPPYGNPNEIFFATPPGSNGEAISSSFIPHAFASSKDFLTPTLTGRVELITGFESFFQTPGEVEDGMDGLAVHRMDWGLVRKVSNAGKKRNENSNSDLEIKDQSCRIEEHEKVDWRLSFEHHKFPLDPLSTPKSSLNSGSLSTSNSSTRSLSHPFTLLLRSNFLPAFSTGLIFKSYQTSQFDEKSRHLLYSPTRNVRGSSALGVDASWDTKDTRDGDYELLIRAKDWWGNEGCVRSKIRVRNL